MPESRNEQTVQFKVSPGLKKEIRRRALERDETVRTFILKALRDHGIAIAEEELIDRRRAATK